MTVGDFLDNTWFVLLPMIYIGVRSLIKEWKKPHEEACPHCGKHIQ